MSLFGGNNETVTTTFAAKDQMTPVVRGIRSTMDRFKRDAATGFGLAAGFSVFNAGKQVIGEVAGFLTDAAEAAMEDEKSVAQLTTTMRNAVPEWEQYQGAIADATEQGLALAFADDEVRASLNRLIPYTHDVTEAIRLNAIAMDLARAKNMSLEEAAGLLGKAYSGQVTALRRAGIAIGNTKDSTLALARVQEQVAGQAEAYAGTTEGSYKTLQLTVDELVESIGYELLPYIRDFATYVRKDVIPSIDDWTSSLNDLIEAAQLAKELVPGMASDVGSNLQRAQLHLLHLERTAVVVSGTWGTTMGGMATDAEATGQDIYTGLVRPARRAMRDLFKTAADAKAPWKAAMKDLAEAGKDPFRDDKFAGWMDRKAKKFIQRAKEDFRNGKGDWRREARALAYVMTNPILRALATTQAEIQALADAAYVINQVTDSLGGFRRNGSSVTDVSTDGHMTPVGGKGNKGNKRRHHKGRAAGGDVGPDTIQRVGERGPEWIVTGSRGAHVLANAGGRREPIAVYIDGRKLFEIMDARQGRAIAMGG